MTSNERIQLNNYYTSPITIGNQFINKTNIAYLFQIKDPIIIDHNCQKIYLNDLIPTMLSNENVYYVASETDPECNKISKNVKRIPLSTIKKIKIYEKGDGGLGHINRIYYMTTENKNWIWENFEYKLSDKIPNNITQINDEF